MITPAASIAPTATPLPPTPRHLTVVPDLDPAPTSDREPAPDIDPVEERAGHHGQDGSLLAEYGLIAVVAAAIAGVLITWASNGAIADLFDALLSSARGLAGS